MNLDVPAAVREGLEWLEFTTGELRILEALYEIAPVVRSYGGDQDMVKACNDVWQAWDIKEERLLPQDWDEFMVEQVCSLEEFLLIIGYKSPLYGHLVPLEGASTVRLKAFLTDIFERRIAPLRMRRLWEETLERCGGNSVAAMVELEFLRPATV